MQFNKKNVYCIAMLLQYKFNKAKVCLVPNTYHSNLYNTYTTQNDNLVSKGAKIQVPHIFSFKITLSAFFLSILMYSYISPRNFLIVRKLGIFSWLNSSILKNKKKVRYWKKLPIFLTILKFGRNMIHNIIKSQKNAKVELFNPRIRQ